MKAFDADPVSKATRSNERVLVIDDEASIGQCVEAILQTAGYVAVVTTSGAVGLEKVRTEDFDLVITDLKLPEASGLDIIQEVKRQNSDVPVILMTSYSSVENAIEALRIGATDYIIKPFANDEFGFAVERALGERRMRKENAVLKRNLKKAYNSKQIIGESDSIKRVLELVQRVASSDVNVLIQGESGTGKELVAQAIHYSSKCANGPFVAINCGAIPGELLESELFGHTKGAFTGAVNANEGLIREASGGTLFLDEIAELPLNLQVKLLRVIQERQVRPLGATQSFFTDTRFLAACNRDLKEETEKGTFRADLYYRLNVISIHIPPLRERGMDVEILARKFIDDYSRKLGKRINGMDKNLLDFLNRYDWPGNVRELQNLIERATILAQSDVLSCEDLLGMLPLLPKERQAPTRVGGPLSIEEYIKKFIIENQHNHTEIELAAMLGIGRKALWVRRNRWGLFRDSSEAKYSASEWLATHAA